MKEPLHNPQEQLFLLLLLLLSLLKNKNISKCKKESNSGARSRSRDSTEPNKAKVQVHIDPGQQHHDDTRQPGRRQEHGVRKCVTHTQMRMHAEKRKKERRKSVVQTK